MIFKKVVETSLYSSDLEAMKEFYVEKLGLEFVSEQVGRHVLLKTQKNMLLLFNPEVTRIEKHTIHGAITPPSMVHIALEIEDDDYDNATQLLAMKNIEIEKMVTWGNDLKSRSIYFRDSAGNLIELITKNHWPILD
jgi:catechol 2,3-dioxygenase-like lactoylglutathione lyase family enzyme